MYFQIAVDGRQSFAATNTSCTYKFDTADIQVRHRRHISHIDRFIYYSEYQDERLIFGLRYEFSDGTNVVEHSLSVRQTHYAMQKVDLASLSGMMNHRDR